MSLLSIATSFDSSNRTNFVGDALSQQTWLKFKLKLKLTIHIGCRKINSDERKSRNVVLKSGATQMKAYVHAFPAHCSFLSPLIQCREGPHRMSRPPFNKLIDREVEWAV
ncbi:Neurofibromin [Fusarium oxysporum f. sp. albedinis]|nr:Neurofibromin [Fusarium oxysporum f. sp. albedinis]